MTEQLQRSEGSLALEAYWKSIRPEGGVPNRTDIVPADIPTLLPNILLMEAHPEPARKLHVRLAGTYLRDLWKIEPTGLDYLNFVPEGEKDEIYNGFVQACKQPCGRWRQVISNFADGGSVRVETTFFPLINNKGTDPLVIVYVSVMTQTHHIQDGGPTHLASYPAKAHWIDVGNGVPE